MLKWAVIFFVLAVLSGVFGFSGIAASFAWIAKILFYVCVVIFVVTLVFAIFNKNAP